MSRRTEKVADQLQVEIADLLHRRVKHPALAEAMLSITSVDVSPDLSRANVRISVMAAAADGETGDGEPDADTREAEVMAALARSEPFLHRELVKRLHMHRVPRLRFHADRSIAEGDRLSALLRDLAGAEGSAEARSEAPPGARSKKRPRGRQP